MHIATFPNFSTLLIQPTPIWTGLTQSAESLKQYLAALLRLLRLQHRGVFRVERQLRLQLCCSSDCCQRVYAAAASADFCLPTILGLGSLASSPLTRRDSIETDFKPPGFYYSIYIILVCLKDFFLFQINYTR